MVSRFFGGNKTKAPQASVQQQSSDASSNQSIAELPSSSVYMRTPNPPTQKQQFIDNQPAQLPPTVPRQNLKRLTANPTINQNSNVDPQKLLKELQQTKVNPYDEKPINPMPPQIHEQSYEKPLNSSSSKIPGTRQSSQGKKQENAYISANQTKSNIPGTKVQSKDYFGVKQNRVKKDGTQSYTFPEQQEQRPQRQSNSQTDLNQKKTKHVNKPSTEQKLQKVTENNVEEEMSEFVQTGDFGSLRPNSNEEDREKNLQNSNPQPQQTKQKKETDLIRTSRQQYNTSPGGQKLAIDDGTASYNTNRNVSVQQPKGWKNSGVSPSRNQNPAGYLGVATKQINNTRQSAQQNAIKSRQQQQTTLTIGIQSQSQSSEPKMAQDLDLPRVEFKVDIGQLSLMLQVLTQVAEIKSNHLTAEHKEQVTDTLWMLTKVFKETSFGLDSIFCQNGITCESLLKAFNAVLKAFNKQEEQITQNTLKLFVIYLQKLDNETKKIELEDLQNSNCLQEGLFQCLDKSETRTQMTSHLTLKILTQISFAFPTEIRRDLIRKIFGFCESSEDIEGQEHGIKLLCNLLTNEKSCTEVFSLSQPPNTPSTKQASYSHSPLIQAIYACFGTQCTANCLKFALGATLNLTLLREDLREQYSELLMRSGGLKLILSAIQTTFKKNEADATLFGLKAVQNLLKYRKPLVKIVAVKELSLVDTILNLQKQMYQIVIKSTPQEAAKTEKARAVKRRNDTLRSSIQCLIELLNLVAVQEVKSSTSESLARSAQFLQFCNRLVLVSVDKPAETYKFAMLPTLKILQQLVAKSAEISENVLGWEQGELGSNIVSLMESTDQDPVLAAGLNFFQAALESGFVLDQEWISRLHDLFNGAAAQNQYSSEVVQAYVDMQALSKKKDIAKKLIDRSNDEITWQEQETLDLYRQAIQDITLKAESQNLVDPSPLRRRIPKAHVSELPSRLHKTDLREDQVAATGIRDDQSMISDTMTVDTRFTGLTKVQNVLQSEREETNQILDQQEVSISKQQRNFTIKGQRDIASNAQKINTKRVKNVTSDDSQQQQSTNIYTSKLSRNALNALDQSSNPVIGTGPIYDSNKYGQSSSGVSNRLTGLNPYSMMKVTDEDVRSMATDLKGGSVRALSMVGGKENTRRATQSVSGRGGGTKDPSHYSEPRNSGLKYQVESRSRSLIKGAGNSGGNRTSRGSLAKDRQKTFEEHVDNFNQLDPLLKGQTLDYAQTSRTNSNRPSRIPTGLRQNQKNSTLDHHIQKHTVVDTHRTIPSKSTSKTQLQNPSVFEYDRSNSPRSIERSSVGLEQADYYSKPDSRGGGGGTLAVHLQNFGIKANTSANNSDNGSQKGIIKKVRYEPLKFVADSGSGDDEENDLIGEELMKDAIKIKNEAELMSQTSHSDAPLVTQEYQQPTFDSYLADRKVGQKMDGQLGAINPFPSLDKDQSDVGNYTGSNQYGVGPLQHQKSGTNLYLPLPSVREENDENELYLPQPQLAKKNNLRQFSSRQELQPVSSQERLLIDQQSHQQHSGSQTQLEKPKTLEEMVKQNQQIIAQRSLKKNGNLGNTNKEIPQKPKAKSTFKIQDMKGQELETVVKFIDINLLDKESFEARSARFQLGIGMPEVRALNKRTGCASFRDQMNWFDKKCATVGSQKAQAEVQSAVCSSMFTQKLISLYVLSARKIGHPLAEHFP